MKTAVVVGSGAGGAAVARELQGDFKVTVLEAGGPFRPLSGSLGLFEKLRRGPGLFMSHRQIQWLLPAMKTEETEDGMVLVKGVCEGGTTTISTGNAVRRDADLKAIGINLDAEFAELEREIPICGDHWSHWHAPTREAFDVCHEMGLEPQPTPKMVHRELCTGCGRCILGCPSGAKWDSRQYLREALEQGAELVSGCTVQSLMREDGLATGVVASRGGKREVYRADLVVLAAGGFGTPAILQRSGIECRSRLFVDPVLCVASRCEGALQNRELPMPFMVQTRHFMVSPYFDFLSYFFNPGWRRPAGDVFSLMIKLADVDSGSVTPEGVHKPLQPVDRARLDEAVELCREVLRRMGVRESDTFLGTLNAGHPGGT
jgi:choline dehydrogenase-like flavoprotein